MITEQLLEVYQRLHDHFGPQHWWPGDTPFEVMVGAVLTQNTSWQNVEKAIDNLKGAGVLSLEAMSALPADLLAEYIRPAGYYNIKAGRLRNLLQFINHNYDGDLDYFFAQSPPTLRQELLSVKGIGPETADSIVLYAAGQPVFVVDAYTHRILGRHNIIDEEYGYYEIQELFIDNLAEDAALFNEYHALLVRAGKEYCKKSKPRCGQCPLEGL
ncbi:ultraviolet N-glycosylase/AP lyase [bacterium BMS3Bbin14]|nr:ultraviolet N-glycosylase/AP lyase [bacterium BMS3Abin13]GBE52914.1 ultraviolet N-glycosylase/AP lyase [bacterium BMS3Bbin14]HDK44361.1 endonuclease III domain-containing protein [Desulfobacteraceae bacterium]HDO29628.1 endonuclease III domain-containing protein [Desulfobacteraceae bacterium]